MTNTSSNSNGTSLAVFSRKQPLSPIMLTQEYIAEATKAVTSPRKSVELSKSGQLYVPTVRKAVKDLGELSMETLIKVNLVRMNTALNLARPMTEAMIEMTAPLVVQHILDDDCDITLADLRLIFDRAMRGYYGQFYNGIGSADVIRWIDIYIGEKCEEYERWHQNTYKEPDRFDRSCANKDAERNAFHEAMVQYEQAKNNKQNQQP